MSSCARASEGWYSRTGDAPELVSRIHALHERYCAKVEERGLTRDDYALIKVRLLEGHFTAEQLAEAVDGFAGDDWHRGRHFTAWRYVIGGDDCNDRIRRWIAEAAARARAPAKARAGPPARPGNVERGMDAVRSYIANVGGKHGNGAG